MIDFLADAADFSVGAKLSDDVLVETALPELPVLVNLFLRVLDDVLEAEWAELVPFVLRGFQGDAVGVLRAHIVERILVGRGRLLMAV